MALPNFQRSSFEPSELEFITLKLTQIDFIPNSKISKFRNLDGNFIGPLKPLIRSRIPLWFSISCKSKNKGKIVCPDWLLVDNLRSKFKLEISLPQFSELPFRWLEISKLLIENAPDDIPSIDEVRKLLKDLREVRQSKSRLGLKGLDSLHLETPNLSSLELNELRPIFNLAHLRLIQLDPNQEQFESFLSQLESNQRNSSSNFNISGSVGGSSGINPSDQIYGDSSTAQVNLRSSSTGLNSKNFDSINSINPETDEFGSTQSEF